MKAVISNRIYLDVTPRQKDSIEKALTYKIPRFRKDLPPEIIFTARVISSKVMSIPSGRMDLIPEGHEIIDKRVQIPVNFPKFRFELREDQDRIYSQIEDSGIINAPPSWGKSFVGVSMATKLGLKTLIVTHNVPLRRQWQKEVKKALGIDCGVIGSGEFDIDSPIVVGNIQTVNKKALEIAKCFGTLIIDECHHCPASTFSSVLDTSHARFKIGLSATIKRKDGRHVLFTDYFGPNIHKASRANAMDPSVEIIRVPIRFPDGADPWSVKLNYLFDNAEYRKYIVGMGGAYSQRGHKPLIVAPRTGFLDACARDAGERAVSVTGKVSHEFRDTLEDQITSGTIDQLYATQSIFSEGISVNPLSALILAGPVNNDPLLEQLIGRIERIVPGKLDPVIADVHLIGKTVQKQASNRMNFYISKGYNIRFI